MANNNTEPAKRKMSKAEKKQANLRIFTGIMCGVMIIGTVAAAVIAIVQSLA